MNEIDIEILKFIYKYGEIHLDKILEKFPEERYSTSYRLGKLSEAERHPKFKMPIPNTSYLLNKSEIYKNENNRTQIRKLDIYSLTQLGNSFIQDIIRETRNKRIDTTQKIIIWFLNSFLFPILVALLTSFLYNRYLK